MADGVENFGNTMQRAFNIESITKIVGSMGNLVTATQQLQNLGSIWADDNLSGGEKAFQTISNLTMSVGMLIPAITTLHSAFEKLDLAQAKEAATSAMQTIASKAKAAASKLVAMAKRDEAAATA
jgi:hypothetical protein